MLSSLVHIAVASFLLEGLGWERAYSHKHIQSACNEDEPLVRAERARRLESEKHC